MAPAAFITALLALLATVHQAAACGVARINVTQAGKAPSGVLREGAYNLAAVQSHFDAQPSTLWLPNTAVTFSCVDDRTTGNYLSTPGGDLAELAGAIGVYFNMTKTAPSEAAVKEIFNKFMSTTASANRRFYLHQDNEEMHNLFEAVYLKGIKPKPTVMPFQMPNDTAEAQIWMDALTDGEYQGCGHLKYMIKYPNDYGLADATVPQALLKAYFEYWWPTPAGSPERSKIDFHVLQGAHDGRAVTIVTNNGPSCTGRSPAAVHDYLGSSVFVYHGGAVDDLRTKVLAPFIAGLNSSNAVDNGAFLAKLNELQGKQLGSTLKKLKSASSLNLFSVAYESTNATASNISPVVVDPTTSVDDTSAGAKNVPKSLTGTPSPAPATSSAANNKFSRLLVALAPLLLLAMLF